MPNKPQIGGSFGGFIAVVVVLAVVIVAACIAVFILLRRNISDADRANRRQRRYQHSALPTTSSSRSEFDYTASSQPQPKGGIGATVRRLLGYGPSKPSVSGSTPSRSRRASSGWQQADSGDEWDASIMPSIQQGQADLETGAKSLSFTDISTHPASIVTSFVPPNPNPKPRNSNSVPSPASTLPTVETYVPSSFTEQAPLRTGSPEPMSGITSDTQSPAGTSTDSSGRKPSFPGGTRFHEEL
ncbi:hypothetical protein DL96DRAFT_1808984 [Flagelloscypha sp. PMI_526]|nr:hypothetical protein DL96DRAFT_1808984 [Flagelloscypha sp. PMI_526]